MPTPATLAGISKRGASASFVAADVADLAAHPGLVDAAFAAFGRLDCLVNNAGVSVLSRAICSMSRPRATTAAWTSTCAARSS